jgi:hypothetical protein
MKYKKNATPPNAISQPQPHPTNLKKTRASYYSGSTADADFLFRISAKRAFHNGRPMNGEYHHHEPAATPDYHN